MLVKKLFHAFSSFDTLYLWKQLEPKSEGIIYNGPQGQSFWTNACINGIVQPVAIRAGKCVGGDALAPKKISDACLMQFFSRFFILPILSHSNSLRISLILFLF